MTQTQEDFAVLGDGKQIELRADSIIHSCRMCGAKGKASELNYICSVSSYMCNICFTVIFVVTPAAIGALIGSLLI